MSQRNTPPSPFDTQDINSIDMIIANAPVYFKKTDEMYKILILGDGISQPSLISIILDTRKKVDELLSMGKSIVISVIIFLITSSIGGIIFLIRYAPVLATLSNP